MRGNLKGLQFGRWRVISYAGSDGNGNAKWLCECECGSQKDVLRHSLLSGRSTSCGCFNKEVLSSMKTHGMSKTPIYKLWHSMKTRCTDPKSHRFSRYGARGIKLCKRWMKFDNFYADMGEMPPGKSIDRIDNDGDYEPSNCRWADSRTQSRNKLSNKIVTINDEKVCISDAAKMFEINFSTVRGRLRRGWSTADALQTPINQKPWRNHE